MSWPLIVVLVLAGSILLVFAVPVRLTVNVHGGDARPVRVQVHAFLGLFVKELTTGSRKKDKAPRASGDSDGSRSARRAWAFVHSRGCLRRLGRYLERLWVALDIGELVGVARIGLDDPAETGELWSVMGPASALLAQRYPDFELLPSFEGARLDVEGRWSVAVVPLEVVIVTVAFALSPTTLRAALAAWRIP